MRQILIMLTAICFTVNVYSQSDSATKNIEKMKLNAGIITTKLAETKEFYTNILDFGVTFENEFYILLHTAK